MYKLNDVCGLIIVIPVQVLHHKQQNMQYIISDSMYITISS